MNIVSLKSLVKLNEGIEPKCSNCDADAVIAALPYLLCCCSAMLESS